MRIGVIDFFCGCGGVSYGFLKSHVPNVEVEIVAGLDIDEYCCSTYRRMVGAPAVQIDIALLLEKPQLLDELLIKWRLERFDKVILVGCSPCQGFAAHRKFIDNKDVRRHLFGVFCEIVAKIQPDAVFMENVPDLFSKRHWTYYEAGKQIVENAGFLVRSRIYNFAGFGLPQERFRAVIMAFKHEFDMPEPVLDFDAFHTVRDAISHLPALKSGGSCPDDPMHVASRHRPETVAILEKVPKNGGNRPLGVGPKCLDRAREYHGGYTDVYGRLSWDKPAVTVTARCRTPSCGRFAHPEQNRGLSVREAALLQGFPEDYYFEGPFDDKYKQIGNAVPPLISKIFAEHMTEILVSDMCHVVEQGNLLDVVEPVGSGFAVTINGIKRRRILV